MDYDVVLYAAAVLRARRQAELYRRRVDVLEARMTDAERAIVPSECLGPCCVGASDLTEQIEMADEALVALVQEDA